MIVYHFYHNTLYLILNCFNHNTITFILSMKIVRNLLNVTKYNVSLNLKKMNHEKMSEIT